MATGHIRNRSTKGKRSYQIVVEGNPDPMTGKRKRNYRTVNSTKKEAEAIMRQMIQEMENGGIIKQSPETTEQWTIQFISEYKPNIADTTRAGYEEKIRNCISPTIGKIPMKALNANTLQKWVNGMVMQNASPKTIRDAYNILNAAMKKAVVLRMIPLNPCDGVELPKLKKYQANIYDSDGIRKVLDVAKNTSIYLLVLLAATVGLRRGELCALKWEHIDLEHRIIHIRENRVLAYGKTITKAPKTVSGSRDISIGEEVVKALNKAYADYCSNRNLFGNAFFDDGYVICQENGKPYRPDSLTQKWERFVMENNLPPIRLHDLRHSNASALIAAGVSPKVVQERLGHSDVTTTLNIYAHITPVMDQAAADKLDSIIFSNPAEDI